MSSAPNEAFSDVLALLKNCPPSDEGILFAFLEDIQPDSQYGMRVVYDGVEGPRGLYVAALIASSKVSKPEQLSEDGYKVVTTGVTDIANTAGSLESPVGDHTVVGYCTMVTLTGFKLDPPRNKAFRVALALLSKVDDEGFHVHELEHIEPEQVAPAVNCMRELRTLSKRVRCESTERRSRTRTLDSGDLSPSATKKARTLQEAPSGDSWSEAE